MAVWLASRDLSLAPRIEHWLTVALVWLFWMQVALWALTAVRFAIDVRRMRSTGPDTLLQSSMEVIVFGAGIAHLGVAVLLALDNLGVRDQAAAGGPGDRRHRARARGADGAGDLLASLSIALDKPFSIGDALQVDDCQGTVEHIGVKSTRLRSVTGEQIIISNADLLKARVRNFGRAARAARAVRAGRALRDAGGGARRRAARDPRDHRGHPDTRFERCHLLRCADKALQFETVYFVTRPDYKVYADAQQSINLRLLERLRVLEVAFVATAPTPLQLQVPARCCREEGGASSACSRGRRRSASAAR